MSFKNIVEYIPQRAPFIMVDKIIEADEQNTVTTLEIKKDNLFVEDGYFYEGGIIENIAQSVAAGAGYRQSKSGEKPKIGVIASIRKLTINIRPKVGEHLNTKIELISEFGDALVVKGSVWCKNTIIASCQMNIFIVDQPQTLNN
jgi:predicted hotdog family 3-hydroxylacyl-ACP dehydratase